MITEKTKAVAAVDYAGQPCDYDALREVCERHDLVLIADAVHSLGGGMLSSSEAAPSLDSSPSASLQAPRSRRAQPSREAPAGSLADLSCFSFHPVKPVATGEGGMVTTDNEEWATRMKQFRNHCINSDHRQRQEGGSWFYEMVDLGYNYRLTDIQCALGSSQLKKVPEWTKRRQEIAVMYDEAFASLDEVSPLKVNAGISHAYHLYVIRLNLEKLDADRGQIFRALRAENIGVNVHYVPVHLHPYYQREMKTGPGMCPVTEAAYERIISLPIFAGMSNKDAEDVIEAMRKVCHAYAK